MQSWSVGSRAPALCRIFVVSKSSTVFGFCNLVKWRRSDAKASSTSSSLYSFRSSPTRRPCQANLPPPPPTPGRSSTSSSSSSIGTLSHCLRRNSDAGPPVPRLSTSSYERVSVEYQNERLDLPPILKLGSSAANSPLHHQESSISGRSHGESSFGVGSSRFMGSPAILSTKLRGTYARMVNAAQHKSPHISELFTGNQILMHITAAPVPSPGDNANVRPSDGLVDAGLRGRDAELKDRIVFFL